MMWLIALGVWGAWGVSVGGWSDDFARRLYLLICLALCVAGLFP